MRIIEPSFSVSSPFGAILPEHGIQMLRFVEAKARLSHRSEEAQTEDSWRRFITAVVLQHADWSVCEHASVTVDMRVDRGSWLEIRTHGLFGYTAESTRFVNYEKKGGEIEIIRPLGIPESRESWRFVMASLEHEYLQELRDKIKPQDARSVLPNCLAVSIAQTGNLRAWRHFLLSRTTAETHPELRRTTDKILGVFQHIFPLLYDDIIPGERQIDAMRKPK